MTRDATWRYHAQLSTDAVREDLRRAESLAAHLESEIATDSRYLVNRPAIESAKRRAQACRDELATRAPSSPHCPHGRRPDQRCLSCEATNGG